MTNHEPLFRNDMAKESTPSGGDADEWYPKFLSLHRERMELLDQCEEDIPPPISRKLDRVNQKLVELCEICPMDEMGMEPATEVGSVPFWSAEGVGPFVDVEGLNAIEVWCTPFAVGIAVRLDGNSVGHASSLIQLEPETARALAGILLAAVYGSREATRRCDRRRRARNAMSDAPDSVQGEKK